MKPDLSILIPVYNEEEFISAVLDRALTAPLPEGMSRELVLVDDGSTDGSLEICQQFAAQHPDEARLIRHPRNRGKGAAIRTAIESARGEFSIVQDADLEYNPNEYPTVLRPLIEGKADAVFGSRFMAVGERRVLYYRHAVANRMLTTLCNLVSDINLTDMETCYKAFRTSLVQSIPLRSERFGIEPELTIKLAKRQVRIYEVPISYNGRTYEEGKKIGLKDAFDALYVILRTGLSSNIYKDSGPETLEALSVAPKFNRWMADTIRPYLGEHVMEIGAGIGNLTRVLVPRKKRYVLTDIDREHLARLSTRFKHRPNVEIGFSDLEQPEHFAPYADQMDSVVCLNVLEHVGDDMQGLQNIRSVLKPGGRAIVLVPHDQRIFGTLDTALGHYRRYSHDELRKKMETMGFEVEKIIDFNRISRPAWYVSGRILKRDALDVRQMKLFDKLVWLWKPLDKVLPWPPTSIIAVGRKS